MSLNIVLLEPEIPHNTGAIARTCALTRTELHLIGPLGFSIEDKYMKRAGLDYWDFVNVKIYNSLEEFLSVNSGRFFFATTKAQKRHSDIIYQDGDYIFFGKETRGLPESLIYENFDRCLRIPMIPELKRSLNLANSVNIILFEALRQLDYPNLK